jgi:CBS domain-containing protein
MKIGEALPNIFSRTYPVLEPKTQMLLAVSLLRFHQIDALPIGFKPGQKKKLAVFGYSCFSKLLETNPRDYGKFLELPCEVAALELSTVDVDASIEELLAVFRKTKFGFAWVESERLGGFASLRDLLQLYEKDLISTKMTVGQVASPIFSLPSETDLRQVIQEMFNHKFRRIFVSGEKSLITDRRILSYVFSTSRLKETSQKPRSLLDVKLGDLEKMEPLPVKAKSAIKSGALSMKDASEDCLVCEEGVITPWDLVMKPLIQGNLQINS